MAQITQMTAQQLAQALQSRELSAAEVTTAHLDHIRAHNEDIHAFLAVSETAIDAAKDIDRRRDAGETLPELAGVPIAVKDMLVTSDMPTTGASRILEGYRSPFDATVVAKARHAGLIPLGKTNMDEFAMGSTTETSAFGVTRNPWDTSLVPGGSGGGSAAALAGFMAPFAFGSDTGGSIRQPAALTGTVGMKPTYGAVSRYGALALASSLDQVGPAARTVTDTAYLHDVMVGHDPHDATSQQHAWESMVEAATTGANTDSLRGVKVGVVHQFMSDSVSAEMRAHTEATLGMLEAAGAHTVQLDAPDFERAMETYHVLLAAEASSNLARFDSVRFGLRVSPSAQSNVEAVMNATRGAGFGAEVKRRLLFGAHVLSTGQYDPIFVGAQRARTLITEAFATMFGEVDVVVAPTTPATAWPLGGALVDAEQERRADILTAVANLAGIPAMSVPVALADNGYPVGVQIMAPAFADARVYRTGAALEQLVTERDGAPFWQSIPTLGGKANA